MSIQIFWLWEESIFLASTFLPTLSGKLHSFSVVTFLAEEISIDLFTAVLMLINVRWENLKTDRHSSDNMHVFCTVAFKCADKENKNEVFIFQNYFPKRHPYQF